MTTSDRLSALWSSLAQTYSALPVMSDEALQVLDRRIADDEAKGFSERYAQICLIATSFVFCVAAVLLFGRTLVPRLLPSTIFAFDWPALTSHDPVLWFAMGLPFGALFIYGVIVPATRGRLFAFMDEKLPLSPRTAQGRSYYSFVTISSQWRFFSFTVYVSLVVALVLLVSTHVVPPAITSTVITVWLYAHLIALSAGLPLLATFGIALSHSRRAEEPTTPLLTVLRLLGRLSNVTAPDQLDLTSREELGADIARLAAQVRRLGPRPDNLGPVAQNASLEFRRAAQTVAALEEWIYLPQAASMGDMQAILVSYAQILASGRLHELPRDDRFGVPASDALVTHLPAWRSWLSYSWALSLLAAPLLALWIAHSRFNVDPPSSLSAVLVAFYSLWSVLVLLHHSTRTPEEARDLLRDAVRTLVGRRS